MAAGMISTLCWSVFAFSCFVVALYERSKTTRIAERIVNLTRWKILLKAWILVRVAIHAELLDCGTILLAAVVFPSQLCFAQCQVYL